MRNSAGSSSQAHFGQIPAVQLQRSAFRRDYTYKSTFDAGLLIPFFVDEILPGDTMSLRTNHVTRLATPIYPYMDNVYMDFHYFFVPNRLVWDNWEKFCGAQEDPGDSTDYLVPQLSAVTHAAGFAEGSVYDYLGLPTKVAAIPQSRMPNALVLRAICRIYNDWYRDENLQNSETPPTDDGPDTSPYHLFPRGRRKDYFTSALPWPQKGPSVALPLGLEAPIRSSFVGVEEPRSVVMLGSSNGTTQLTGKAIGPATPGLTQAVNATFGSAPTGSRYYTWPESGDPEGYNFADLSDATAATINQLREAFQLQRLFERDARGGTRYVEILLSHFGVVSPDFRLQRPEYLGGGTTQINSSAVPQTSASGLAPGGTPQGTLAAYAKASGEVGFNHSFVEHGHVIGFVSVRADVTYQQGMNRMWSRQSRYDFYWPTLAHLGEQAVLNKEIYMDGSSADDAVFGYQERFAEYRYKPGMVTGAFRSNATTPLDAWHLALDFGALPTLASLVVEDPPIDRIIAVPSEPQFIFDSFTQIKHVRCMPAYSTPGLIDHF